MENEALTGSNRSDPQSSASARREGRNVWVLTAYGISGLLLFSVLIYYFSRYITQ